MADHTIDDLMQREIDGATSAADSARLQDILSRDPQARARYEELEIGRASCRERV